MHSTLHYAAHAGFSKYPVYNEIVTLLLKSGSKPNETNKVLTLMLAGILGDLLKTIWMSFLQMRMTAIQIAAKMGNPDIFRTLLEHEGDPQLHCQVLRLQNEFVEDWTLSVHARRRKLHCITLCWETFQGLSQGWKL